jgi:hypothetical protein
VVVGGWGGGVYFLCDTQRKGKIQLGTVHSITRRFGHEGLMKTILLIIIVERVWAILSVLVNFKIAPLQSDIKLS